MIDERHRIPLETTIQKGLQAQGANVTLLYKACAELYEGTNVTTGHGLLKSRHTSKTADGEFILAVVTDEATGFFLQLGGVKKKEAASGHPLLTFGKKFLMEIQPNQLQNTAMKFWS